MPKSTPFTHVNLHGQPIRQTGPSWEIPKKPKPEKRAAYHNGWKVFGHRPGAMEEARDERRRALISAEDHNKRVEELRRTGKANGEALKRVPAPWDPAVWRKDTKKRAVRSKPYETTEAAAICAALATREGWLDVEVIEQSKGEAPPQGFF